MRILGIDPGLERIGFGLIEQDAQQRYHASDWGVITTSKHDPEPKRLQGIYETLTALVDEFKPDVAAVEKIFFFRNATTMVPVCQARGIILLVLYSAGVQYWEYTPMQVKQNVTGSGKADKKEIQHMIKDLLGLNEIPQPDDAADALAIALSCAFEQGPLRLFSAR